MIQINQLTLRRGVKTLLQDSHLTVYPQERVGIIGANGAGKTTLFALLNNEIEPDKGDVSVPDDWRIAQVEQHIQTPDREAVEFVIDGDHHLRTLQAQRENVDLDDGEAVALLETALTDAGAWSARARAEQLLIGLGFTPDQWTLPVKQFSGGWQMRLALARALMAPSDLLLLDEPTNHLDLDAMLWLEQWLKSYDGTVLVISHDTEFLDAVCSSIIHFENQQLHRYRGNYSQFQRQRTEKLRLAEASFEKKQQKIAHMQRFIERFRAQASKAKQAQSRIKALERMQPVAPIVQAQGIEINFPNPDFMPDPLLRLSQASLGYRATEGAQRDTNNTVIFESINATIRAGSRIGILGMNGAGKSTFVKSLAGTLPLLKGERIAAQQLKVGYFAQHQLDMLDRHSSPLLHMQRIAPQENEQALRSYLGRFGFQGTKALDTIEHFSGGEKARLALALIVWDEPNLLLLDEPTNHLDIDTRDALSQALTEYEGSVLIVSHDRQLLRQTVDEFWLVNAGQITHFDGDLEDYKRWFFQQQSKGHTQPDDASATQAPNLSRREIRQQAAAQRQALAARTRPLEKQSQAIEKKLEPLQKEHQALLELIGDAAFYTAEYDAQREEIISKEGTLGKEIAALEEKWLELQTEIEEIIAQLDET